MPRDTLRATKLGKYLVEEEANKKGWGRQSQAWADAAYTTVPTLKRFWEGKPITASTFIAICKAVKVDWEQVCDNSTSTDNASAQPELSVKTLSIDNLVETVREKLQDRIIQRCGMMRVLDMTQPIDLEDIYINVNVLEKITRRRRLKRDELLESTSFENFERFTLGKVSKEQVPGMEAVEKYSKLMILGKPGAGKTTFLKFLALQCIEGRFRAQHIPLFITLKDFAELPNQPSLLDYLNQLINYPNKADVEQLLNEGRLLILLDGLDEVKKEDSNLILNIIKEFTIQYHKNYYVITCRIAAQEYTFENFTEAEIADFNWEQITNFINKWFGIKNNLIKSQEIIRELQKNKPIQDIATNPLFLTLLCLVFEEFGKFPSNRSKLYEEGLDILFKKWDIKRNIKRSQVYKDLSLRRQKDLLSQFALETFERGDYFFKQEYIETYIIQYMSNLMAHSNLQEELDLDSEGIIKLIESQHGLLIERAKGIYSFSHLTFHEYFAAKEISNPSKPDRKQAEMLQYLVTKINEKRWREIFLLTVGMLESADYFLQLMKSQIDMLFASDEALQQFRSWVRKKSNSVKASYKPAAIRAFYLDLARALDLARTFDLAEVINRVNVSALHLQRTLELVHRTHTPSFDPMFSFDLALHGSLARSIDKNTAIDPDDDNIRILDLALDSNISSDLVLDRALFLALGVAHACTCAITIELNIINILINALNLACEYALDPNYPNLQICLKRLKEELPINCQENCEDYGNWWKSNGQTWTKQLRYVMTEYRDIGHDLQFSNHQLSLLQQYYDANLLLVNCLNSECSVSSQVKQELEDTLLLPITLRS
ncbi:NACHT domain family protein (plasmid) [Calothrix brevissima NIES-22]|nr:NACHT domain family protein [Calothrix brevissima NIES-22]